MSVHYDSFFYNENENKENENKYIETTQNVIIKDRLSPTIITYITRLKQNVPNIDIHFFGSVTNFTFFENNSDVDCCIIYPDENSKNKVVQFITEDSLQFDIKRITFQQVKLSHPKHADEFGDVYCIFFNDGSKIDFNLVPNKIGPILSLQHNMNVVFLVALYILKWLFYYAHLISKEAFIYMKAKYFKVYHYMYDISVFRSEKQIIKNVS
jgi:predicted nucleotidyltransferase